MEKAGVFQTGDICPKTGKPVLEVLFSKHPGACPLTAVSFEAYGDKSPEFLPVHVIDKTVAYVTQRQLGSAGPGGTILFSLQHWLLRFRAASAGLQNIVGEFGD